MQSAKTYYPSNRTEKAFINMIWRLSEQDFNQRREIILPKGTVEIIFNFSDKITYFSHASQTKNNLPGVIINGINCKPVELIKTGRLELLGIQLNSIGLKALFNIPAKELTNNVYEGKLICQDLDTLADQLYCSQAFKNQVNIILKWFQKKVSVWEGNHSVKRAQRLHSIECDDSINVKKLCEVICLSERHLRRFSSEWIGMKPEKFIQYKKYLNALHFFHSSKNKLRDIALEAGYYDQPHFIREFKSFTGMTPRQYRNSMSQLPGHIYL